jgi:hypothetical protein
MQGLGLPIFFQRSSPMSIKAKRTPGLETAHPFAGLRPVNPHAAGVDIGATEIIACVPGDATTQLVRAFGTYTIDLHAISQWFRAQGITTVAMDTSAGSVQEAPGSIGFPYLKRWKPRALNVC